MAGRRYYQDGYFATHLVQKYGMTLDELREWRDEHRDDPVGADRQGEVPAQASLEKFREDLQSILDHPYRPQPAGLYAVGALEAFDDALATIAALRGQVAGWKGAAKRLRTLASNQLTETLNESEAHAGVWERVIMPLMELMGEGNTYRHGLPGRIKDKLRTVEAERDALQAVVDAAREAREGCLPRCGSGGPGRCWPCGDYLPDESCCPDCRLDRALSRHDEGSESGEVADA